jgi:hypothetical protein
MADLGVLTDKASLVARNTPTYSKILNALVAITYFHLEGTTARHSDKYTFAHLNSLAARTQWHKSEADARIGLEDFIATLSANDVQNILRTVWFELRGDQVGNHAVAVKFLEEMVKSNPKPCLDWVIHQILEAHFAEVKSQRAKDRAEHSKNLAHLGPDENETGADGGAGLPKAPLTKPAEPEKLKVLAGDTRETKMSADKEKDLKPLKKMMSEKARKKIEDIMSGAIQAPDDALSDDLPQAPPMMPEEPKRQPRKSLSELKARGDQTLMMRKAIRHAAHKGLPQGSSTKQEPTDKMQALPSFDMEKIITNLELDLRKIAIDVTMERDASKLYDLLRKESEILKMLNDARQHAKPQGLPQGSSIKPAEPDKAQAPSFDMKKIIATLELDASKIRAAIDKEKDEKQRQALCLKEHEVWNMIKDALRHASPDSTPECLFHTIVATLHEDLRKIRAAKAQETDPNKMNELNNRLGEVESLKSMIIKHAVSKGLLQGSSAKPAELKNTTAMDEDASRLRELVAKKKEVTGMINDTRHYAKLRGPSKNVEEKIADLERDACKLGSAIAFHEAAMRKKNEAGQHAAPESFPVAMKAVMPQSEETSKRDVETRRGVYTKDSPAATVNVVTPQKDESHSSFDKIKSLVREKIEEAVQMLEEAEEWAQTDGVREADPANPYMLGTFEILEDVEKATGISYNIEDGIGIQSYSYTQECPFDQSTKAELDNILEQHNSVFNKKWIKMKPTLQACKDIDKITSLLGKKIAEAGLFLDMAETLAQKDALPEVDTLVSEAIRTLNRLNDATGIQYRFECGSGILDYSYTKESVLDKSTKARVDMNKVIASYMSLFNYRWLKFSVALHGANRRSKEAQGKAAQKDGLAQGTASESLNRSTKEESPQSSPTEKPLFNLLSEVAPQKIEPARPITLPTRSKKIVTQALHGKEIPFRDDQKATPKLREIKRPSTESVPGPTLNLNNFARLETINVERNVRRKEKYTAEHKARIMEGLKRDAEHLERRRALERMIPGSYPIDSNNDCADLQSKNVCTGTWSTKRMMRDLSTDSVPQHERYSEKLPIGLEPIDTFNVRARIVGRGGENIKSIQNETGCKVQIKGQGSCFKESSTGEEAEEPMFLYVVGPDAKGVAEAKGLCEELLVRVKGDYQEHREYPEFHAVRKNITSKAPQKEASLKGNQPKPSISTTKMAALPDLKTPIPMDLVPLLAKDEKKQQHIIEKGMGVARALNKEPTDNTSQPAAPIAVPAKITSITAPAEHSGGSNSWPLEKRGYLSEAASTYLNLHNPDQHTEASVVRRMLDGDPADVELCEQLEAMGLKLDRAAFAVALLTAAPKHSRVPAKNNRIGMKRLGLDETVAEEAVFKRAKVDKPTPEVVSEKDWDMVSAQDGEQGDESEDFVMVDADE